MRPWGGPDPEEIAGIDFRPTRLTVELRYPKVQSLRMGIGIRFQFPSRSSPGADRIYSCISPGGNPTP